MKIKSCHLYIAISCLACGESSAFLLSEWLDEKLQERDIYTHWSFSGEIDCSNLSIHQSVNNGDANRGNCTFSQGDINIQYSNRANNVGYGAKIGIKTRSGIVKQDQPIINDSYLYVDSLYGQFKFGYTNTAADDFYIGGDSCLVGYQGFGNGTFASFYNVSAGAIVDSGCPFDDGTAAKIAWLSPTLSGFSCGISYTFDSNNATIFKTIHERMDGIHNGKEHSVCASSKRIVTLGLAYEYGAPDDFYAKIACAYWIGKADPRCADIAIHNVRAFNIGAMLAYNNFQLTCGYTDNGKSYLSKKYATESIHTLDLNAPFDINDPRVGLRHRANAGRIYSIGLVYEKDQLAVSLGYMKSITRFSPDQTSSARIISCATEYKLNKTFSFFAEYNNIVTRTCKRALAYSIACDLSSSASDNKANMLILGTKIRI